MSADKETKQALLPTTNREDVETDYNDWQHEKASLRNKYLYRFAFLQLVLLVLYIAGGAALLRETPFSRGNDSDGSGKELVTPGGGRRGEEFVYIAEVDKFEKMELNKHLYKDNPYKGPPSPEVDEAWSKLFNNAFIRLSEDELVNLGRNSTLIPDGSGDYIGALDVYHQLHCVQFIFQYVHQDYYTLRKINVPKQDHINHCIDILRQVVMCYADTSISTMTFHDHYWKTWPEFKFEHSCRNWDAIDTWAGLPGRAVDQSDPKRIKEFLRNPNFVDTGEYFDGHGEDD